MQVWRGDTVRIHDLVALDEATVPASRSNAVDAPSVHALRELSICTLPLRSLAARYSEFAAAGVHDVVLFHSTSRELFTYTGGRPLDVVDDRDKQLNQRFGVETSLRGLLDPRVGVGA